MSDSKPNFELIMFVSLRRRASGKLEGDIELNAGSLDDYRKIEVILESALAETRLAKIKKELSQKRLHQEDL